MNIEKTKIKILGEPENNIFIILFMYNILFINNKLITVKRFLELFTLN
jgi:hypothetical protein